MSWFDGFAVRNIAAHGVGIFFRYWGNPHKPTLVFTAWVAGEALLAGDLIPEEQPGLTAEALRNFMR